MALPKRLLLHRELRPIQHLSLALLAAAAVTVGGMSVRPPVVHASGTTVHVADGGSGSTIGPCWGCD
jgi:hypothetical protein